MIVVTSLESSAETAHRKFLSDILTRENVIQASFEKITKLGIVMYFNIYVSLICPRFFTSAVFNYAF